MIDFDVDVILPAAGSGERFGTQDPKQYCPLMGKPLFVYALEIFSNISWIKNIVLVVDDPTRAGNVLADFNLTSKRIHLVEGGLSRHRTIFNGITHLKDNGNYSKIIIIHDALRPFVPVNFLEKLVLEANEHGASGSIRPLVSTVIKPDKDYFINESLNRSDYVASETPQAFKFDLLEKSYSESQENELDTGTECLQLLLNTLGIKAKLLLGPEELWKVTYKKDFHAALGVLKEKINNLAIIAPVEFNDQVTNIFKALELKIPQDKMEFIRTNMISMNKEDDHYNNCIVFHFDEILDDFNKFRSFLDVTRWGVVIQVIVHESAREEIHLDVIQLYENGKILNDRYNEYKKGVVIIHCLIEEYVDRLSALISSIILSDYKTFSGQVLFI